MLCHIPKYVNLTWKKKPIWNRQATKLNIYGTTILKRAIPYVRCAAIPGGIWYVKRSYPVGHGFVRSLLFVIYLQQFWQQFSAPCCFLYAWWYLLVSSCWWFTSCLRLTLSEFDALRQAGRNVMTVRCNFDEKIDEQRAKNVLASSRLLPQGSQFSHVLPKVVIN